jgi:hypothetical protein
MRISERWKDDGREVEGIGFLFLFFEDKNGRMTNEDQGGMRDGFGFFSNCFSDRRMNEEGL